MSIIKQTDNRTGITYAYEVVYRWDKEKKQSRRKCTMIGRIDDVTGEIVPTDGRGRRKNETGNTQHVKKDAPNYEKLYNKLLKKFEAQEILVKALQKEISRLEGRTPDGP